MRRLVVAAVVVAVVLGLVGCGGGGSDTAATTPPPAATPAPAPAPAADAAVVASSTGLSANEAPVFEPFPSTDASIPANVKDLVESKQPALIYFYDSSQNASKENRKVIDSVIEANRGLVDLAAFDIGKYVTGDPSKPVEIDPDFAKDAKYQQAVTLARLLKVSYTPYIVLTDNQGYIIWKYRGLVDKDFLEREVLRASN